MFLSVLLCIVLVMVVGVSSFRFWGSKTDDEALRRDDERRTDTQTAESLPSNFDGQTGGTDVSFCREQESVHPSPSTWKKLIISISIIYERYMFCGSIVH